jgi:hypothetical protein
MKKLPGPAAKAVRQQPRRQQQQKLKSRQVKPVTSQESLEKMLMRMILNPVELKTQRTRIVVKSSFHGVSSEKREGVFINAHGIQETIQEEIRYVATFTDGTPAGDSQLARCQTCGQVVNIDSLERCPCGKTVCRSKGCGIYIEGHDQWYCCKKHAVMRMFKINLSFFS